MQFANNINPMSAQSTGSTTSTTTGWIIAGAAVLLVLFFCAVAIGILYRTFKKLRVLRPNWYFLLTLLFVLCPITAPVATYMALTPY